MMKPNVQLKISQQLTMTPQMQQAIRLLQLSTLELCQEIQTSLELNPLLEIDEQYDEIKVNDINEPDVIDTYEMMENREITEDIPFDASLEDIYTAGTPSGTLSDYRLDELPIYQGETHQTLSDYLMWQLNLSRFSEQDKTIAISLIQAINEQGYLTSSLQDIWEEQGNDEIELNEIEVVLKRIQCFDPIGVGARSLQECLMIQIDQLSPITEQIKLAKRVIINHIDLLGKKDFRALIKALQIDEMQLKNAISLIQQLQPYPGDSINTSAPEYVIADISVKKIGQQWDVIINNDPIPRLKINQHYASMIHFSNERDGQYIRQSLQQANWLIKSIENRNETLTKVSHYIVKHQQLFFEYGEEYMQPMVLADVANSINMHESTISRVTTQKYLQCPRGIFELKYFFSSHIATKAGGEASSTAIRAVIKKLVQNENSQKPLSDSKISSLLKEQGIIVARRTVAKYRESQAIPPSSQRKQLK